MIRAILLDIDGTLTNSKKEITPKTKEALLKAQEAGIILAVVSAGQKTDCAVLENGLISKIIMEFLWRVMVYTSKTCRQGKYF